MRRAVIVVGAGPVGLTCTALLRRAGVDAVLLEAATERARDLRASTWHPPTLDLLATLDLARPLVERGLVAPTWQVRMHPSGERAVFDLAAIAADTAHPFRLQCEQQVYCELLESRLAAEAPGALRRGTTVVGLAPGEDAVRLHVHASDGTSATLSADWVIGADGAHSTIRRGAGLALEGDTYPETTILATTPFPFERHLEGLSNVNYCWAPDGTFSLLRLPGTWRVSLYADDGERVEDAATPAAVQRKLQRIVPTGVPYEVTEVRPYRIHRRIVSRYRAGRVLLAGDAAHLNSPSGGMGMNGGLHDAFSLCAKLARVVGGDDPALLDRYDRERRPVAADEILAQAHRNRSRMQERDPGKRRATLVELQAIAGDPVRAREYLLRSSMIEGLRRAQATA